MITYKCLFLNSIWVHMVSFSLPAVHLSDLLTYPGHIHTSYSQAPYTLNVTTVLQFLVY